MVQFNTLLGDLATDFAARVRRGVDVDVVLAARQVGGLRVGQRGAALRTAGGVGNRDGDAGVLAGFGRPMEMRRSGRAGQAGIVQLPAQLFGGRIVVDVGGAFSGAG